MATERSPLLRAVSRVVCDVITVLVQGAVLASGPPAEMSTDSRVLAAYLGKSEDPDEDPAKRPAPNLSAAET